MYRMECEFREIIAAIESYHRLYNRKALEKAYQFASVRHEGQYRKSGEAYIKHPMRVARYVAQWGLGDEVVIAALLHDVVEDCGVTVDEVRSQFGHDTAYLVDAVSEVKRELQSRQKMSKEELDALTDAKLQRNISDSALFIKTADRLDNLHTIFALPEAKQLAKARHTRDILVPMIVEEGAYELAEDLEDLCFAIEHRAHHTRIGQLYEELLERNYNSSEKTIQTLVDVFLGDEGVEDSLTGARRYVLDFQLAHRYSYSIFRNITSRAGNLSQEFGRLFNKENVPLYDLTLIYSDDALVYTPDKSLYDVFFLFYETALEKEGITVLRINRTAHDDATYLLLADRFDNLYRLFLRTQKDQLKFRLGRAADSAEMTPYTDVNEVNPTDTYNEKIKVFRRDGSGTFIDKGATVLDFAFMIHSEVGLHFDYAMINFNKTHLQAYTRLQEGDTVEVVTTDHVTANIHSFNYLRTSRAISRLVKYFERNGIAQKDGD